MRSEKARLLPSSDREFVLSNYDLLYFIERDFIAGAVVELGDTRAFVRGHRLGTSERSTSLKMGRDPG